MRPATFKTMAFLLPCLSLFTSILFAQDPCINYGSIYNSNGTDERGFVVTPTANNDGFYLGGFKDDSVLFVKYNLDGSVAWSRVFDIIPGQPDYVSTMITDSDGMIGFAGMVSPIPDDPNFGGFAFVVRYDPENDQILWARSFQAAENINIRVFSLLQLGAGGNYLLSTNPHEEGVNDDLHLLELDLNTGIANPAFSKNYTLTGSEDLMDLVWHDGFVYGTGRYTANFTSNTMRASLAKIDVENGTHLWNKLGFVPGDADARLYGYDLAIDSGFIYSTYYGDEDGSSVSNTNVYVQKATLDGELVWVKKYDLPGTRDLGMEMVKSGNGFVVMGFKTDAPGTFYLFKIDTAGQVQWSKAYEFDVPVNDGWFNIGQGHMIEVADQIVFTGYTVNNQVDDRDILVVRTDLEGNTDQSCVSQSEFALFAQDIINPVLFDVTLTETDLLYEEEGLELNATEAPLANTASCILSLDVTTEIAATICEGGNYDGYTSTGIYIDTIVLANSCDSIRILMLTVENCQPECGQVFGPIYSGVGGNDRGYSLASNPGDVDFFVAGAREDSVLIMRVDNNGQVEWARTFDVVPGTDDNAFRIIVDSDNNLVVSGISGDPNTQSTVFVAKYDHSSDQLLWVRSITSQNRSYNFSIVEKSPGGNYIMSNNPHGSSDNDAELLEIDRNNGSIVSTFSKNYNLGNSDDLVEIIVHDGFIYGNGRFRDNDSPFAMRNTLMKLNVNDGTPVWTKMGHSSPSEDSRLYGTDLVIFENFIYSVYSGDPDGTSLTNTEIFIQKTSLDGELIWLKHYPLPGLNDIAYEIIPVEGDLVVYAKSNQVNNELSLFRINTDGHAMQNIRFEFPTPVVEDFMGLKTSQLIQAGNKLVAIATTRNIFGEDDMILFSTDLNINPDVNPCLNGFVANLNAEDVPNPSFFDVTVDVTDVSPEENARNSQTEPITMNTIAECTQIDTAATFISAAICNGDIFEGYTNPGVYTDTFDIEGDCDSVRILTLAVVNCQPIVYYDLDACRSYMIDGSHMDFSEFTPEYPVSLSCTELEAGNVHMIPGPDNKHSCTPGVNGTVAMCVGVFNTCTYQPGHSASVIFEMNVDPVTNGEVWVTGLEFYEKAPVNYVWIDGPTGLNNYPQFYGIRILRDGVEIYRQENVATNLNWNLEEYSFVNDSLFRFEEPGVLRFELFPYCPIGNGAEVSAWDLDEIRIFGACAPSAPIHTNILGNVTTKQGQQIEQVKLYLGNDPLFHERTWTWSDAMGFYQFDNVVAGQGYFLMGYNNNDVLHGVSTLDMLFMQKHLLGIEPFTSLDQYVAADINYSGHVSAVDILELRKTLLGLRNDFPKNRSWRIGSPQQDFNSTNPFTFDERITIEYLDASPLRLDFLGIKVGDVNGDIILPGAGAPITTRNNVSATLSVQDQLVKARIPFTMQVRAEEAIEVDGMQFTLDCHGLGLIGMSGKLIPVEDEHYSFLQNDEFRLSWNASQGKHIQKGDILFTLELVSAVDGYLSELITLNDAVLKPQIYTPDQTRDINLEFEKTEAESHTEGYCHIAPNLFSGETQITFYLPEGGETHIAFYTLSGEMIFAIDRTYTAGVHTERITAQQLAGTTGVIVCQLMSDGFTSVQKLVHLK